MAKKDAGKSTSKGKAAADESGIKIVARNRKARHDYELLEKVEAGIVLTGTEVKSLRNGKANLEDSYAEIDRDEVWLLGCDIPEYLQANRMNHVPKRQAEAPAPPPRDRQARDQVQREGPDARPSFDLLQERDGQGRALGGPRPQDLRQARGPQEAGREAGYGPGPAEAVNTLDVGIVP